MIADEDFFIIKQNGFSIWNVCKRTLWIHEFKSKIKWQVQNENWFEIPQHEIGNCVGSFYFNVFIRGLRNLCAIFDPNPCDLSIVSKPCKVWSNTNFNINGQNDCGRLCATQFDSVIFITVVHNVCRKSKKIRVIIVLCNEAHLWLNWLTPAWTRLHASTHSTKNSRDGKITNEFTKRKKKRIFIILSVTIKCMYD